MTEIPQEAYERAAVAVHDSVCNDRTCSATVIGSVYGMRARAAVDAVWPLAVAAGRREAAEAIRAQIVAGAFGEWAARIAEGEHDG